MTPREAFLESLARCESSAGFAPRFYRRFLTSSEDVARMFRLTDFDRQQRMLIRSLELSAKATVGDQEGLRELNARADSHARLAIPAEMYDLWLASAIATARECDPQWTAETEHAWKTLLGFIIHHMTRSTRAATDGVERRRSPRLQLALGGTWRTKTGDPSPCLIGDINRTGCFICGYESHPPGTHIEVTLTATGRPPLSLRGKVVHAPRDSGFGVVFDELLPADRVRLDELLDSFSPTS